LSLCRRIYSTQWLVSRKICGQVSKTRWSDAQPIVHSLTRGGAGVEDGGWRTEGGGRRVEDGGRRPTSDLRPLTSGSRSGSVKDDHSTFALWGSKLLSLAQWSPVRAGRTSATARLFSTDARW